METGVLSGSSSAGLVAEGSANDPVADVSFPWENSFRWAKALLLIGSLLLGAFVMEVAVANSAPKPTGTIGFHGSQASLSLLSAEATRCGLFQSKVERIGKFLTLTVKTSGFADPHVACLVQWVLSHPEAKVGFIGNEAFATGR